MEQQNYCKYRYFCYAESDVSAWLKSCESSHQRYSLAKWSWENIYNAKQLKIQEINLIQDQDRNIDAAYL